MHNPDYDEEATRVPQPMGDSCVYMSSEEAISKLRQLTFTENGDVPTLGKNARGEDTKDQEDGTRSSPPADKVTDQVDLLVPLVLGPETDALLREWPRAG